MCANCGDILLASLSQSLVGIIDAAALVAKDMELVVELGLELTVGHKESLGT